MLKTDQLARYKGYNECVFIQSIALDCSHSNPLFFKRLAPLLNPPPKEKTNCEKLPG